MELEEVLDKIQGDQELTRRFVEDPTGVLQRLGVDSEEFTIEEPPKSAGIAQAGVCVEVCTKVGVPFSRCKKIGQNPGLVV